MNKAIFLDRDNTINYDHGYIYKKEDFKFLKGSIEGLKMLYDMGYILIIVSNQSGIGRGYFTVNDLLNVNNYMLDELEKHGVKIKEIFYCPHTDEDNCECRKPKTKLFYDAIKKYDINVNKSYAIGDRERDLCICEKEPIKGILITEEKSDKYVSKKNIFEAAKYIKLYEENL